ncbi:FMN-binding protein [Porticoccaceae bacterium LTM1]|nr:FMN-binding protein [Porticoccaceae bacterium LTM1]
MVQSFGEQPPKPTMLWLNGEQREQASKILDRRFGGFRVRYWQQDDRTAWVMDEIGKELPITIGIVVADTGIEKVEILEYRESRGGEVKYPFFTSQFSGARLDEEKSSQKLDTDIDGISGATLSVRAVKKVATLALFFHHQISQPKSDDAQTAQTGH